MSKASTRVCILTTGQPSNNPRVVKEADALAEAGYAVHAIGVDCGLWPSHMDAAVMARRSWSYQYVGGMVQNRPLIHRLARLRQSCTKRMLNWFSRSELMRSSALLRVGPELLSAALSHPAELFIAHHAAVLPAAGKAAAKFGACVGYDAEDFYSGMHPVGQPPGAFDRAAEAIERQYLESCDYVTASSLGIADAYVEKYRIPRPEVILNVFPLIDRPPRFRPSNSAGPLRLYWFSQCIGADRGLEDIVNAMGLLGDAPVELHLRGNWQAGYRQRLFAVVRAAGVESSRIVSHEPAPPDEMARLSAEYDVGLAIEQPVDHNRTICLSNKLFVYLLAGNAIAATNMPGQESLAGELAEAAWFYRPGDVRSLAEGIRRWCNDRLVLENSRRSSWEWGSLRYNWDSEKETFVRLVKRSLDPASAGVRSTMATFA